MTDKMFDTEYLKQHMGDYAKELNPDVAKLEPIVEALKEKTKTLGIEVEHDVTALENPYFKTFNYTSYAGFLTVHPLQPEHSARQMLDAWYSDESEANHDWYDFISANNPFKNYIFTFSLVQQMRVRDTTSFLENFLLL